MRHTLATTALEGGANVVEVQQLLGHSSLDTTRRYLERELIENARAHGFLLMRREEMENTAEMWGDEPVTSLYHLLFIAEGEMPWRRESQ